MGQLLIIAIWSVLFCLKKNGVSAWKAILFSEMQDNRKPEEKGDSIDNKEKTPTGSLNQSEMRVDYDNDIIIDESNLSKNKFQGKPNDSTIIAEDNSIIQDTEDKREKDIEKNTEIIDIPHNEERNSTTCSFEDNSNSHKDKQDSSRRGNLKKWIIGCICLIILIIGFFIIKRWFVKTPEARFEEAKNLVFKHNNVEEAIPILIDLLNENDSSSGIKTMLGIAYLGRKGDKLDSQKGLEYLRDAANKDTLAIRILIDIYRGKKINGNTFTNDIELKKYAELAIKKKCYLGEAYYRLGNVYANQEQYLNAYYYWQKATEYNVPSAYINIGKMYYLGYGCPIDYEKAREFFLRANEISPDNATTLYFLGMMYKYGLGFPKDLSKAKEYLKRSANNGNERAQRAYAEMEINN
jgi:tetratricopeptide (TPR) repeat protein